jgi:hypothetical protein
MVLADFFLTLLSINVDQSQSESTGGLADAKSGQAEQEAEPEMAACASRSLPSFQQRQQSALVAVRHRASKG